MNESGRLDQHIEVNRHSALALSVTMGLRHHFMGDADKRTIIQNTMCNLYFETGLNLCIVLQMVKLK